MSYGVITDGSINLFVHCSISDRQKLYCSNGNFGTLFYEVISSPFILWEFDLDILAKIVFNYCDKHIVPALLSGIETEECRNFTVCSPMSCSGLKKDKIIETVFISGVDFSRRLAKISCRAVNSHYILEDFSTYQQGIDFNNPCYQ